MAWAQAAGHARRDWHTAWTGARGAHPADGHVHSEWLGSHFDEVVLKDACLAGCAVSVQVRTPAAAALALLRCPILLPVRQECSAPLAGRAGRRPTPMLCRGSCTPLTKGRRPCR